MSIHLNHTSVDYEEAVGLEEVTVRERELILYNDDFNTFDSVSPIIHI